MIVLIVKTYANNYSATFQTQDIAFIYDKDVASWSSIVIANPSKGQQAESFKFSVK